MSCSRVTHIGINLKAVLKMTSYTKNVRLVVHISFGSRCCSWGQIEDKFRKRMQQVSLKTEQYEKKKVTCNSLRTNWCNPNTIGEKYHFVDTVIPLVSSSLLSLWLMVFNISSDPVFFLTTYENVPYRTQSCLPSGKIISNVQQRTRLWAWIWRRFQHNTDSPRLMVTGFYGTPVGHSRL